MAELIIVAVVLLILVGRKSTGALLPPTWTATNDAPTADGWQTIFGTTDATGLNQDAAGGIAEAGTMQTLSAWAAAIKQHEGWTVGSRSYRNNNPGNLVYTGQAGATGKDSDGFAIFPTEAAGMAALESDLAAKVRKYPNYSILQIMTRYLGGDPSNPPADGKVYYAGKYQGDALAYAAAVANSLGASITDKLNEIFA